MRARLMAASILAGIIVSTSAFAETNRPFDPAAVPEAPVGHRQPRAQNFSPDSTSNRVEDNKLSKEDARQQQLDRALDKRLNICGC